MLCHVHAKIAPKNKGVFQDEEKETLLDSFLTLFLGVINPFWIENLKTEILVLVIVYMKTVEALQTYHGKDDPQEHFPVFVILYKSFYTSLLFFSICDSVEMIVTSLPEMNKWLYDWNTIN